MLQIRITIIVPVYNVSLYLETCIESIINQTYRNLQIILVDDGSTDCSGEICDFYAGKDRRIEVYHTENRGLVRARKLGLKYSKGEYIGFVDGDDYVETNMFELMLLEIHKTNADFVHTGFIRETEGCVEKVLEFEEGVYELQEAKDREEFLKRYLLQEKNNCRISYSIWSKLYKRALIQNAYSMVRDDQQYGEDLLSLCFCILKSRRISLSRQALYHYIVKEKSMSHLQRQEYAIKEIELCGNISQSLSNYDRQLYKNLEKDIYGYVMKKLVILMERINMPLTIPRYYLKGMDKVVGKKVIVYGAGGVGRDYYIQFCKCREIEIIAWMDSNWKQISHEFAEIVGINRLKEYVFDKIVIAVRDENTAKEISTMLSMYGLPEEKIMWEKPGYIFCSE